MGAPVAAGALVFSGTVQYHGSRPLSTGRIERAGTRAYLDWSLAPPKVACRRATFFFVDTNACSATLPVMTIDRRPQEMLTIHVGDFIISTSRLMPASACKVTVATKCTLEDPAHLTFAQARSLADAISYAARDLY